MNQEQILRLFLSQNLFEEERHLKRNEYLKVAHSMDTNIYFIEEGSFKISISDQGEERIIRFGYPPNIIVALDSFFGEKSSEMEIQALKKAKVRIASKAKFKDYLENHPDFMNIWNLILQDLVLQQMEREVDLLTQSPKLRYERVLKRSPKLFQEIPNRHIANYLRMSPETLSRLKNS